MEAKVALGTYGRAYRVAFPDMELVRRAAEGHVHTWAPTYSVGPTVWSNVELPASFWAEFTLTAAQDWALNDFKVTSKGGVTLRAKGVHFNAPDLGRIYPKFGTLSQSIATKNEVRVLQAKLAEAEKALSTLSARRTAEVPPRGGRPMSDAWPEWVAELVTLIHEEGLPSGIGTGGADDLTARVADRLAERDLEAPARTTVQETIKAVLRRLRDAGN